MRKLLKDLVLDDSTVIVRVDFNVPINPEGKIIDDTRLKATLPTLRYLLSKNCKIVLISHLGRPEGPDPQLSLKKILPLLQNLLSMPVHFIEDYTSAKKVIESLPFPSIALLENLRFYKEEEAPTPDHKLAQFLASLGDFYVNEAFACSHRSHSSITEICKFFPNKKAAGILLQHEIEELQKVLSPSKPFFLLLGGSKISTKIPVINSLLPKADSLFIGGAMAFPFMKALGISIGSTELDLCQVEQAQQILNQLTTLNKQLFLPLDWKCKKNIKSEDPVSLFQEKSGIPLGYMAYDIGPETVKVWSKEIQRAETIFWNGPFGMYEVPPFDQGTKEMAEVISHMNCTSIVGGGDTVAAIEKQNLGHFFTHLSTGGGASLEFLEKGTLPGITALDS